MKRLYRSKKNRIIAGVCGGIAEYFNIDPTIVRLLWLLVVFERGSRTSCLYHSMDYNS